MSLQPDFQYNMLRDEPSLAWRQDGRSGPKPGILFLPGFYSNMTGTKACFLAEKSVASGRMLTRFDYRGHGFSSGTFEEGTIGDWLDDAVTILDKITQGPQIVVGSSMGGWIMLLLALKRPERVAGMVGIAPAPDFTEDLLWKKLTPMQQHEMRMNGVIYEASEYEEGQLPLTFKLVEEGRKHLLLGKTWPVNCPTRFIQGMRDKDVPWGWALRAADCVSTPNVRVTLVKDGDHRLSRPEDLELLWQEIESVSA